MSKWTHFKRCLDRVLHPNAHIRAAIRLGEMRERKKQRMPLPPIFGGYPVYIPMPAPMPDLMGMFARPQPAAVIPNPHGRYFKQWCHAYSETVEVPRIKPPRLVPYDGPPLEDDTAHEVPAWIV